MQDTASVPSYRQGADRYRQRMMTPPLGWIRARERQLVRALVRPLAGERVLDAGCGAGFDASWLVATGATVVGVDGTAEMVEAARREGLDARVADLCTLELAERFEHALCLGALEFCVDPLQALRRIRAHLVPKARLTVLYPWGGLGSSYRLYHRLRGERVRLFAPADMDRLLHDAGFELEVDVRATLLSRVVQGRKR